MPMQAQVDMVLQPKIPPGTVHNATAILFPGHFFCEPQDFPKLDQDQVPAVLVVLGTIKCYSSKVSESAQSQGYAGVLVVFPSSFFEMANINYWNRKAHGVPVYRTVDTSIDWLNVTRIWLEPRETESYYHTSSFKIQNYLFSGYVIVLNTYKNYRIVQVLKTYWRARRWLNYATSILMVEFIIGLLFLLYSVDLNGMLGIFSFPMVSLLNRLCNLFTILSTCLCWDLMKSLRYITGMDDFGTSFRYCRIIAIMAVAAYIFICTATIIDDIAFKFLDNRASALERFCFIILGIYFASSFLMNKFEIVKILSQSSTTRRRDHAVVNSYNLAMCGLFMTVQYLTMSVGWIPFFVRISSLVSWYSYAVGCACMNTVCLYQVLSVPCYEIDDVMIASEVMTLNTTALRDKE